MILPSSGMGSGRRMVERGGEKVGASDGRVGRRSSSRGWEGRAGMTVCVCVCQISLSRLFKFLACSVG